MPSNVLRELGKRLQYGTRDASTVSTKSQQSTQSSEQYKHMPLPGQWTEPTSQFSDSFEMISNDNLEEKQEEIIHAQPNRIDSDLEAQCGSDSVHSWGSTESSSNSSDNSMRDLPRPTRDLKMKEIGGHFGDIGSQREEPTAFPEDDEEARIMIDKIKRASATTHAADKFESHLQPESAPELSIQRDQILGSWVKRRMQSKPIDCDPPVVDIEHQGRRCPRDSKARATMFVFTIVLVFIVLISLLYANIGMT